MEGINIDQYTENRFFQLMDRLVEWQIGDKKPPIKLLNIYVMPNYANENTSFQELLLVGNIESSENDIRRTTLSNAPGDRTFMEDMNDWFKFGYAPGCHTPSFYQTCAFGLNQDMADIMLHLRQKCVERYGSQVSIKFNIPERKSSGGCYIATCVYGSYDCPEVWTLRRFRDYKLEESWVGRAFIRVYYAVSPKIVKLFGKTKWFNHFWRGKLDCMVKRLQKAGYEDTPYYDR